MFNQPLVMKTVFHIVGYECCYIAAIWQEHINQSSLKSVSMTPAVP